MPATKAGAEGIRVPPGLDGVILCETSVSNVDGIAGAYRYRYYDAVELAEKRDLEDVWHLMLDEVLPTPEDGSRFRDAVEELRGIPPGVAELLVPVARLGDPARDLMASLRSSCSLLGEFFEFQPIIDLDPAAVRMDALRVCAVLPTIAAALHRLATGQQPVPPRPGLGTAANYLYMLSGEEPDPAHARLLEQYMILAADHEMGAGTFAARVVVSTGADFGAAAVAALGALSGPLHGGAPERTLRMLREIGTPARIEEWLMQNMARGGRVSGFGHRVYRTHDPRAVKLRELAGQLGGDLFSLAESVEAAAAAFLERTKPDRDLQVNVEFYAAVLMSELGIPPTLFSTTFALARMPGWSAHILEQAQSNRLIRPLTEFAGGPVVPVPEAV